MPVRVHISIVCLIGAVLAVCLIGCNNQGTTSDSDGVVRALQGTWKETGINLDKSMPQDESTLAGLMLMFDHGEGGKVYSYSATELVVTDSTGAELHRWPYILKDSLLIFGSDTAMVRWKHADAFTAYSHGVSVSYERLPGEGH